MRHDGCCAGRAAQAEPVGIYRQIRPSGGGTPDLISGRVRASATSAIRARDNAPRLTSATTCHGSFNMKIHPRMLRHACGFKLANDGVDSRTIRAYLGHKSIQHAARYTELAPTRFKEFFRD
jgi:integrase